MKMSLNFLGKFLEKFWVHCADSIKILLLGAVRAVYADFYPKCFQIETVRTGRETKKNDGCLSTRHSIYLLLYLLAQFAFSWRLHIKASIINVPLLLQLLSSFGSGTF